MPDNPGEPAPPSGGSAAPGGPPRGLLWPVRHEARRARWVVRWGRSVLWGLGLGAAALVVGGVVGTQVVLHGLDDAGRGRLVANVLTAGLPGSFEIAGLQLDGLRHLVLTGVHIAAPDGTSVAGARRIEAGFSPWALLRGRVAFAPIRVDDPSVTIEVRKGAPMPLIQAAFVPPPPPPQGPPPAADMRGVRVTLDDVTVRNAHIAIRLPGVRGDATEMAIDGASFWAQGDTIGLALRLRSRFALRAPAQKLALQWDDLRIEARGLQHRHARDNKWVACERLQLDVPHARAVVRGEMFATDSAVGRVRAEADVDVGAAFSLWRRLLPAGITRHLSGSLGAALSMQGHGSRQRFELATRSHGFAWKHVGLSGLSARGELDGMRARLDSFELRGGGGKLSVSGQAQLFPDPPEVLVGEHTLRIDSPELPLRALLAPFTQRPGLLPESVSLSLRSHGRSLWPPTSEVDLELSARGMPRLPVMPDPFVAHGKLLTHPDAIEIFRLQLGGEDHQVALQGIVPFAPQGVLEIYDNLHIIK